MAQPVVFEGAAGWYHQASGNLGVVLCGPHGHETLCVHRHWRALAEGLANAGLPTLRFDYPGTGDSIDDDLTPGRVDAWIESVSSAIRMVRKISGADRVALVGLRMGALLAAQAAARLGGVEALVLLAPYASGEACFRELRALAMMAARQRSSGASRQEGGLEAAGFVYTQETLDNLRRLTLFPEGAPRPGKVLILNRGTTAQAQDLAAGWAGSACSVDVESFDEFPLLLRDAESSAYPERGFGRVVTWLAAQRGFARARAPAKPWAAVLRLPDAEEAAVYVDRHPRLFGVMCTPHLPPSLPVLVFLNTGRNHHIGASRMTVSIARRLAKIGFASLRLDLGGVGESDAPLDAPHHHPFDPAAVGDVRRALDWLEDHGHRDVVLVGLCSGAKLALETASVDDRVCGQILLNLQGMWKVADPEDIFLSRRAYFRLAGRLDVWKRLIKGEVRVWGIAKTMVTRSLAALSTEAQAMWHRLKGQPSVRDEALKRFHNLARRRIKTSMIYVDDDPGVDELQVMFGSQGHSLATVPNVSLSFMKDGDHMFSWDDSRRQLLALVEQELARMIAPSAATAPRLVSPPSRHLAPSVPNRMMLG